MSFIPNFSCRAIWIVLLTHKSFLTSLNNIHILTTLFEASSDENWKQQAMNKEMEALKTNETWELVDLPAEKKAMGCKWVYTVK